MAYEDEDSRLRGERRREAIDDLRHELLQDDKALIESAEKYLKKGVIERQFRPMVEAAILRFKHGERINNGLMSAVAGVVAFIEIDQ